MFLFLFVHLTSAVVCFANVHKEFIFFFCSITLGYKNSWDQSLNPFGHTDYKYLNRKVFAGTNEMRTSSVIV